MLGRPRSVISSLFYFVCFDLIDPFTLIGVTNPNQFILFLIHLAHLFAVELIAFVLKYLQTDTLVNIQSLFQESPATAFGTLKQFFPLLIDRSADSGQRLLFLFFPWALLLNGRLVEVGTEVRGLIIRLLPKGRLVLGLLVHRTLVIRALVDGRLVIGV